MKPRSSLNFDGIKLYPLAEVGLSIKFWKVDGLETGEGVEYILKRGSILVLYLGWA